jgi:hypothetical protein
VVWHILKPGESSERSLKELFDLSADLAVSANVAQKFFRIVGTRDLTAWPKWRDSASHSRFLREAPLPGRSCRNRSSAMGRSKETYTGSS